MVSHGFKEMLWKPGREWHPAGLMVFRASGAEIQLFGFIFMSGHFLVENSAVTKYLWHLSLWG